MTNGPAHGSRVSKLCLIALAGLIMGFGVALGGCGTTTDEGKERHVATPTPDAIPTPKWSLTLGG
jgi:hypothetical protein